MLGYDNLTRKGWSKMNAPKPRAYRGPTHKNCWACSQAGHLRDLCPNPASSTSIGSGCGEPGFKKPSCPHCGPLHASGKVLPEEWNRRPSQEILDKGITLTEEEDRILATKTDLKKRIVSVQIVLALNLHLRFWQNFVHSVL